MVEQPHNKVSKLHFSTSVDNKFSNGRSTAAAVPVLARQKLESTRRVQHLFTSKLENCIRYVLPSRYRTQISDLKLVPSKKVQNLSWVPVS
jgi:hypothetical protein